MSPKGSKVDHRNTEPLGRSPTTDVGKPRRPAVSDRGRGASRVVGARESRVQGEGRQGADTPAKPEEERSVDTDRQADKAWLLNVQRKLYQWSRENPDEAFRDLWSWVTDPRNLRCAWRHVASNRGKQTPGIDGMTVRKIRREKGENAFLDELRQQLRKEEYRPSPCRRKFIRSEANRGVPTPGDPHHRGPHGTVCGQANPGADL